MSLGLLYYCKRMPVALLTNIYITLDIVNNAQSIAYGIITWPDNKSPNTMLLVLID